MKPTAKSNKCYRVPNGDSLKSFKAAINERGRALEEEEAHAIKWTLVVLQGGIEIGRTNVF